LLIDHLDASIFCFSVLKKREIPEPVGMW